MNEYGSSASTNLPQRLVMTFELVADESEGDVALVNAIGRDTVAALQHEGYTVHPIYTGQKGGFIVEVVTTAVQLATTIWDNRMVAEEVITDLSGLVTIFGIVVPPLKHLIHAHEQRAGKEESSNNPIKITLEIDGEPLLIEASDLVQVDAALRLAQQFSSIYPTSAPQITSKSKVKVQGHVPAHKRRRHR